MEPEKAIERFGKLFEAARREIAKVIVGHEEGVESLLCALFSGGHVLIEGVPGIGKTRLAQTAAAVLSLSYRRIQFTPDLMPGDITGTEVLEEEGGRRSFRFVEGPLFGQLVLADEVNRATPKTQSALLEAMQEGAVTVSGKRNLLPEPFFVLATQNPIEMAGTYPLPEAQLDRFMLKLLLDPPGEKDLAEIVERTTGARDPTPGPAAREGEVLEMQRLAREVPASRVVTSYVSRLVAATHPDSKETRTPSPLVKRYVRYGASPRAAQALVLSGKAAALAAGRAQLGPSDVKKNAPAALRHRLILGLEARAEGVEPDSIIAELLERVPVEAGA